MAALTPTSSGALSVELDQLRPYAAAAPIRCEMLRVASTLVGRRHRGAPFWDAGTAKTELRAKFFFKKVAKGGGGMGMARDRCFSVMAAVIWVLGIWAAVDLLAYGLGCQEANNVHNGGYDLSGETREIKDRR